MTREEAIKILKAIRVYECYPKSASEETKEAIDMAIEALQEVQKHEEIFEWCHDCKEYDTENYCCHRWSKVIRNTVEELNEQPPTIPCFTESAEAYKAWTGEEMGVYVKSVKHPRDCNECWLAFPNNDWDFTSHCRALGEDCPNDGKLQNCPLVDRPHGEWIKSLAKSDMWHCSVCGSPLMTDDINETHYCPNCGARMKGGAE